MSIGQSVTGKHPPGRFVLTTIIYTKPGSGQTSRKTQQQRRFLTVVVNTTEGGSPKGMTPWKEYQVTVRQTRLSFFCDAI
jgi:hypothetical protein